MIEKIDELAERLVWKMDHSRTPVPGFIIGLSGTDSIVAFMVAYKACQTMGIPHRLHGVHYTSDHRKTPTRFQQHAIPWLHNRCPEASITMEIPMGGNYDQQRWADLHMRALNMGVPPTISLPEGENFWVCGTINATEKALGTYSMLATAVSLQLIQTLWKSAIMQICEELDVPQEIMDDARIPDCWCGRDELAASNIELIDDILNHRHTYGNYDQELVNTLLAYVRDTKSANAFKLRVPYII